MIVNQRDDVFDYLFRSFGSSCEDAGGDQAQSAGEDVEVDINQTVFNNQFSPLIAAIVSNNLHVFTSLLSTLSASSTPTEPVEVNHQNKTGHTALMFCVKYKRIAMLKQLLNLRSNPGCEEIELDVVNSDSNTVLMEAVKLEPVDKHTLEIVKLLLSHPESNPGFVNAQEISALILVRNADRGSGIGSGDSKRRVLREMIEDKVCPEYGTTVGAALAGAKLREYCLKLYEIEIREVKDTYQVDDKFLSWNARIGNERHRKKILGIFSNLQNSRSGPRGGGGSKELGSHVEMRSKQKGRGGKTGEVVEATDVRVLDLPTVPSTSGEEVAARIAANQSPAEASSSIPYAQLLPQ